MNPIAKNTEVWNNMFDWIEHVMPPKYPNETVVTWILGYANTHKVCRRRTKSLRRGLCCQSISVFINEGFLIMAWMSLARPRREERRYWLE